MNHHCKQLTNQKLIQQLKALTGDERKIQAEFLAHLAEVDSRRLFAELGYSSLFRYCMEELGLAECTTYKRIAAARAASAFPFVYTLVVDGKIHVTAIAMLKPHMTPENAKSLMNEACGKSKADVERMIARLKPQSDVADSIRTLPTPQQQSVIRTTGSRSSHSATRPMGPEIFDRSGPSVPETPARHDEVKPLSEERVKFQFSSSAEFRKQLEQIKALLWHKFPEGRLEDIFGAMANVFLEKKLPKKNKQTGLPRLATGSPRNDSNKRYIPQRVKNTVWKRDKGQCQFTSANGKQCASRIGLEYDHIKPWALGGESGNTDNIRLLCRTHNQFLAQRTFGDKRCV